MIYNLDEWMRDTRGRSFLFFACDEEIVEIMSTALPKQYEPYSLIGTYLEKEPHGKNYVEKHRLGEINEFSHLRSCTWKFFLRSSVLTPELAECIKSRISARLALNGLTILQHGRCRHRKQEASAIMFVTRIRNIQSEAVVEHTEYSRVFNAFKRALQKRLVFGTRKRMPDGTIKESTTLRMTELFAQRCQSGEIVAAVDVGARL